MYVCVCLCFVFKLVILRWKLIKFCYQALLKKIKGRGMRKNNNKVNTSRSLLDSTTNGRHVYDTYLDLLCIYTHTIFYYTMVQDDGYTYYVL